VLFHPTSCSCSDISHSFANIPRPHQQIAALVRCVSPLPPTFTSPTSRASCSPLAKVPWYAEIHCGTVSLDGCLACMRITYLISLRLFPPPACRLPPSPVIYHQHIASELGRCTPMGKASDIFRTDRYRSQAHQHAGRSYSAFIDNRNPEGPILPLHNSNTTPPTETGGLSEKDGRAAAVGPTNGGQLDGVQRNGGRNVAGGGGDRGHRPEASNQNDTEDSIYQTAPPPTPPPHKSEDAGAGNSSLEGTGGDREKPALGARMVAGIERFGIHTKDALFHSWVNVLLVFVPIGIAVEAVGLNSTIVFAMNAVAIVPLAGLLSHATESVASRMGDTLGALLNVSFGNAVELIIFIIALVKNEIRIVQASLLGSILANLLLILGMAFLFGGLRFREQIYNSTVTQMSACLLSLSVMSLLLPVCLAILHDDPDETY